MATSLQTLISLLSTTALILTVANAKRLPPKGTVSFSYDFHGGEPTGLTYQGDAHFPSQDSYLRLTKTYDYSGNAVEDSVGRVLYTEPVPFWEKKEKASFESTVKFIITPNTNYEYPPADGLVFFITAPNSTVMVPGGTFGVFDHSGKNPLVFAVEFDIFINEDFDPYYRHVGIDIQSQVSSVTTGVDDAIVGQAVTATINYDAATNLISVRGSAGGKAFEVSYVYDLSSFLPEQVQVGISGATGGLSAIHDLISWSFTSTMGRKKNN
ncbi:agglutinin-2-like [Salvia hispanica]|uniref:agglutinin-2-like n=1 Tax=Salvia hispanica TaxID=49212 RepID=UPI0020099BAC|nr:agglutinin-2-like [Salvia hispanica]